MPPRSLPLLLCLRLSVLLRLCVPWQTLLLELRAARAALSRTFTAPLPDDAAAAPAGAMALHAVCAPDCSSSTLLSFACVHEHTSLSLLVQAASPSPGAAYRDVHARAPAGLTRTAAAAAAGAGAAGTELLKRMFSAQPKHLVKVRRQAVGCVRDPSAMPTPGGFAGCGWWCAARSLAVRPAAR